MTGPPLSELLSQVLVALTIELDDHPRRRLPHHPTVLHRGGWPDGS